MYKRFAIHSFSSVSSSLRTRLSNSFLWPIILARIVRIFGNVDNWPRKMVQRLLQLVQCFFDTLPSRFECQRVHNYRHPRELIDKSRLFCALSVRRRNYLIQGCNPLCSRYSIVSNLSASGMITKPFGTVRICRLFCSSATRRRSSRSHSSLRFMRLVERTSVVPRNVETRPSH